MREHNTFIKIFVMWLTILWLLCLFLREVNASERIVCETIQNEEKWFGMTGHIYDVSIGFDKEVENRKKLVNIAKSGLKEIYDDCLKEKKEELLASGKCVKVDFSKKQEVQNEN